MVNVILRVVVFLVGMLWLSLGAPGEGKAVELKSDKNGDKISCEEAIRMATNKNTAPMSRKKLSVLKAWCEDQEELEEDGRQTADSSSKTVSGKKTFSLGPPDGGATEIYCGATKCWCYSGKYWNGCHTNVIQAVCKGGQVSGSTNVKTCDVK